MGPEDDAEQFEKRAGRAILYKMASLTDPLVFPSQPRCKLYQKCYEWIDMR